MIRKQVNDLIHINVYMNMKKDFVGFSSKGHSGYAEQGHDIICAAASVLMINSTNAIEKFTRDAFTRVEDDEEGYLDFELKCEPSEVTKTILKTMVLGLKSIQEQYDEYISLSIEEV